MEWEFGFVNENARWRCPEGVVLLPIMDLKLPLPLALVSRKDNSSPLLSKFVEDVRFCQRWCRLVNAEIHYSKPALSSDVSMV